MSQTRYDTSELRRLDVAHHLPGYTDYKAHRELGGNRIVARGEGCYIYDTEGNALLDGMGGLWCVQLGYGRKELADAAHDQMVRLPYYNTFFKTSPEPTVRLAARVASLLGGDLTHLFFNNSGSEAIDSAIRIVRYYWQVKGKPERNVLIARNHAYHGTTIAGTSLGGMFAMHKQGGPWLPGIEHIMPPYGFVDGFGEDPAKFAERAANALEERILKVGPEKVAAFFGEPVMGAGGVIIAPDGYWPRIEAICRKYGVLFVSDEVICGFGRMGKWFGFQHYGVKPDMVTMAKGITSGYLPLSAVGVSKPIVEALREGGATFLHGYTYSGHPTSAAVALKNLEIIEREKLVERTATDTAPYLAQKMKEIAAHPLVGEARSAGLLGAIEIVSKKGTNQRFGTTEGASGIVVRDTCIKNGVMVRAVRDMLVMAPPLVITHAELDKLFDIIRKSLDEAEPLLRALQ
jgi:putrescine aminotransferase